MKIDISNLPKNLPSAFIPILTYQDRYLVCWGGAGSGKSEAIARKHVARCLARAGAEGRPHKFLCCRKTLTSAKKSLAPLYEEIMDQYGIPISRREDGFLFYTLPGRNRLIVAGFDDPEKIKSVPGITGVWFEEANEFDPADFREANRRLRGLTPSYKQFCFSFNPVLRSTWLYEEFFANQSHRITEGLDQVAIGNYKGGGKILFHHSTYRDNPFIDEEYKGVLRGLAQSSQQDYIIYEQGLWGRLEGTIYYAFGPDNIQDEIELEPGPVYWSHDFNIGEGKPMSSCVCQRRRHDGRDVLYVLDEIIVDGTNTNDIVDEFRNRYPNLKNVIICGDATGRRRDTRSRTSDYQILRDAGFQQQDVPLQNPPVRDRHNAVNTRLKSVDGTVSVYIHPRCKTLIRGLESVALKSGASYIEEETREQHVTTAFGYLIARLWPVQQWKHSGQKHWK